MKTMAIVVAIVLTNGAISDSSAQDAPVQRQKGGATPTEDSKKYHYKVFLINNKIYLKFLENDSKEFGPFDKYKGQDGRYIYMPKGRPLEFASAMQIYRDRASDKWFYTDNWVQMRAMRVDPNDILPHKESEQGGTGQPATRPESKSERSEKPQPKAEGRSR